ncbi:MAG: radical SAM protein [Candidatus Cloacimonetes bacterium]|nr:radical SAM protein [Candidatus Cloacimonadota bacterium]
MAAGYIFNVKRFSVHDGPGIRTTVFFMGCPLRCLWCHNPESWQDMPFTFQKEIKLANGATIRRSEKIGYQITAAELIKEILKDEVYFNKSGGGATFSGGEPLSQPDFLYECLRLCKANNLHTALDTSGYGDWNSIEKVLELLDIILFDIKILDNHNKYTGVDNKLIIANLRKLKQTGTNIQMRLPLIKEINGDEIDDIISLLIDIDLKNIALLPYHNLADAKKIRYGITGQKGTFSCPEDFIKDSINKFEKAGFSVKLGG